MSQRKWFGKKEKPALTINADTDADVIQADYHKLEDKQPKSSTSSFLSCCLPFLRPKKGLLDDQVEESLKQEAQTRQMKTQPNQSNGRKGP